MYFNLVPNIEYDVKPISYPFKSSEFSTAKNFFRRFELNPDVFSYSVLFKKYAVPNGQRIDQVAELTYGDPFYDWVILITNNIVNPLFDWPRSEQALRKYCEGKYQDPYATILHYETYEVTSGQKIKGDSTGRDVPVVVLEAGLKVDENFYNSPFSYWDGIQTRTVSGSTVCFPVTAYDYEQELNESRREIYLLKPEYLSQFVTEFKTKNNYKESTDFISIKSKKTGV
jgi:hypothetical protein